MQEHVVIVAGGKGLRMGTDVPKQFLDLKGRPVLMRTIERFYAYNNSLDIVLVLPETHLSYWDNLCKNHRFSIPHRLVTGGAQRFYSVKNGLDSITDSNGLVAVHDAVRPLLSVDFLRRLFDEARQYGTAIPYIDTKNTLRKIETNGQSHWVNRELYKQIQTPQIFKINDLKKAYRLPYNVAFTDDAALYDALGWSLHLVPGEAYNIKITTPDDLLIAEAYQTLLEAKSN